jgi:Uma2 family endonuclease
MAAERAYVTGMSPLVTAEELLQKNIPNKRTELVRGRLIVREPAGYSHGRVTMNLTVRLGAHVEGTGCGQLVAAETGFTLFRAPDTVRAPDVGFVRRERLPDPATIGFPEMAPDLVVEVLSPDDRPGETLAKVGDWLEAGARLAWVIDPQRRLARVYRADGTESPLAESDALDGEDVLPGFNCQLGAIL